MSSLVENSRTNHESRIISHAWGGRMDQRMLDTLAIKEVVENWAVFRDFGDWERFRSVWRATLLPKPCNLIRKSWRNFPKAIVAWPTCNPASDSRSRRICLG